MKKFPFISLALLLGAYTTFSWLLYEADVTWQGWVVFAGFVLVQTFLLTTQARKAQQFVDKWLTSDLGYFSGVLLIGLLVLFALAWLHIFGHVLVLASAEILARLDLRRSGYSRVQALVVLLVVSIVGLSTGAIAYSYIHEQSSIELRPPQESNQPFDSREFR